MLGGLSVTLSKFGVWFKTTLLALEMASTICSVRLRHRKLLNGGISLGFG